MGSPADQGMGDHGSFLEGTRAIACAGRCRFVRSTDMEIEVDVTDLRAIRTPRSSSEFIRRSGKRPCAAVNSILSGGREVCPGKNARKGWTNAGPDIAAEIDRYRRRTVSS